MTYVFLWLFLGSFTMLVLESLEPIKFRGQDINLSATVFFTLCGPLMLSVLGLRLIEISKRGRLT